MLHSSYTDFLYYHPKIVHSPLCSCNNTSWVKWGHWRAHNWYDYDLWCNTGHFLSVLGLLPLLASDPCSECLPGSKCVATCLFLLNEKARASSMGGGGGEARGSIAHIALSGGGGGGGSMYKHIVHSFWHHHNKVSRYSMLTTAIPRLKFLCWQRNCTPPIKRVESWCAHQAFSVICSAISKWDFFWWDNFETDAWRLNDKSWSIVQFAFQLPFQSVKWFPGLVF